MTEPQLALPDRVGVVNVGLSLFADAIREHSAKRGGVAAAAMR